MRKPWVLIAVAALSCGCSTIIDGTPTWPGAQLDRVLLTEADFPQGVNYGRITETPGDTNGVLGGPSPLPSEPQNCSNGLTDVIAASAEIGPGSAAKYNVIYDGARIVITVLTSDLDLAGLSDEAGRCESFETFFDRTSQRIPMTTTKLASSRPDELLYRQTMRLSGVESSVFMSFENIGRMSVFGIAFPTAELGSLPQPPPKASLPQTFTEIVDRQAQRIQDS